MFDKRAEGIARERGILDRMEALDEIIEAERKLKRRMWRMLLDATK